MKLSNAQLAVLALIIANLIWGAAPPIFKWSFDEIQPFTMAFLRFSIAAAIIYPFVRKKLLIHRSDIIILLFIAIIGFAFHIAYAFVGLQLTSSINLPIIASASPIFLIVGSIFFLHEKPRRKVLYGVALSLVGVLFIVLRPIFENGLDTSLLGNIFFIVAMGLSVFYVILLKEIAHKYNPLTLIFWIFLISAITFLPLLFIEAGNSAPLITISAKSIIGLLFGIVLSSCVAHVLHAYALKRIAANEVAVFSYIDPVIAVLIAKPLLGESITTTFLIGSALIFAGIFIAEGRIHYHPIHLLIRRRNTSKLTSPPVASTPHTL